MDNARQTVAGKAENNVLFDNSTQEVLAGGRVKDTYFWDNTHQIVAGRADDSKLNNDAIQTVEAGGYAGDNAIHERSQQVVLAGGRVGNSILFDEASQRVAGVAVTNTLWDNATQTVTAGGKAAANLLYNSSVQIVEVDGKAENTSFDNTASQIVMGTATSNQLFDNTTQEVQAGGNAEVNDLMGNASQIVAGEAGYNILSEDATQTVKAGGFVFESTLNDNATQKILAGGKADVTDLVGNASQTVMGVGAITRNTMLYDATRSTIGAGAQATGYTILYDQSSISLEAAKHGVAGASVDSLTLRDADTRVIIRSGDTDAASASIAHLQGQGSVIFNQNGTDRFARLEVDALQGNHHFFFNTSINDGRGDYLSIQNGSGSHQVSVQDSGAEIADPISKSLDLISDRSKGAAFSLADLAGLRIDAVDGGTYMYYLKQRDSEGEKTWYLGVGQDTVVDPKPEEPKPEEPKPEEPKPEEPKPEEPQPPQSGLRTTPSTDAVLSMAAAPAMMFKNELANLRVRRGDVVNSFDSSTRRLPSGAWARLITGRDHYNPNVARFELDQTGFELGGDHVFTLQHGQALVGMFAGYSNADVKHQRGGKSEIDSATAGVQLGYFADTGWYVDGVLKFNRFNNKLRATSTNHERINAKYKQNGVGVAVEAGYNATFDSGLFVEPYARLLYANIDSKNIRLSNGMTANIGSTDSLSSELAVRAGTSTLTAANNRISYYATLGWSHEFVDNNRVVTNDVYRFTNDFSGDVGRYGVGMDVRFANGFQVYGELNYRKGHRVESPIAANVGVRYQF